MDISINRSRTHIPLPILGEGSDEQRYHETLQRVLFANHLWEHRSDSDDADLLYRKYLRIHAQWLAHQLVVEQQELELARVELLENTIEEDDDESTLNVRPDVLGRETIVLTQIR